MFVPVPPAAWTERHAAKVVTAADAVRRIRPGQRIFVGSGAAVPRTLIQSLVTDGAHLADDEIVHLMTLGDAPYAAPAMASRFRHLALFIGENVREAVAEGRADFMPVFLHEIPRLFRSKRLRIDVALVTVSPPDARGFVSLGVSVDVVRAAMESAALVIAEVNPRMPRAHGDAFVSVDAIDLLVPVDRPLPEHRPPPLDDVDRAIGSHVATLVPDGATLQLGIGRVPNAVLEALRNHRHLGVHSEMFSDGVVDLVERGVIDGTHKSVFPGKVVASFVLGSQRLYDWVDDNPRVALLRTETTNDPAVIARHDRMVAINSALAVDLGGQVAADGVGGRLVSGIGGQIDFVRGASASRDGKAILALRSTAKHGAVSRIVAELEPGSGVVTSRGDVRYVVTEHGVADLWGKSLRQRALALIDVAHPDVRGELLAAAKRRRTVALDQRLSRPHARVRTSRETLADGTALVVRSVRTSDERGLRELFYRLDPDSRRRRFLATRAVFGDDEMGRMVDTDDVDHAGVVATTDAGEIVAFAELVRDDDAPEAEIAVAVATEHQRRGVGTRVLARLAEVATSAGIERLRAEALVENVGILALLRTLGAPLAIGVRDGTTTARLTLAARAPIAP